MFILSERSLRAAVVLGGFGVGGSPMLRLSRPPSVPPSFPLPHTIPLFSVTQPQCISCRCSGLKHTAVNSMAAQREVKPVEDQPSGYIIATAGACWSRSNCNFAGNATCMYYACWGEGGHSRPEMAELYLDRRDLYGFISET